MSLASIGIGKLIASAVVLGAAGFGGFNYMTTGCALGSCDGEKVALTEVALTTATDTTPAAITEEAGCCDLTAALTEVAVKTETDGCCADKAADAQLVANKTEACSTEKACATETACSTDKAAAQLVSTEKKADGECCGGSECGQDCGEGGCGGECPAQVAAKDAPAGNG
jgi:hypothetical protein